MRGRGGILCIILFLLSFILLLQVDRGSFYLFRSPLRRIKFNASILSSGLKRVSSKPLIKARPDARITVGNDTIRWEKLVYNPAAVRINGVTYILYRALGYDGISRIGLAWSKDGIHNWQRLDYPIFGPTENYELPQDVEARKENQIKEFGEIREVGGTEDPRITIIGNYLYMTYTAYGEIPQIGIARIKISDFLKTAQQGKSSEEWQDLWQKQGILFPGERDKDAVIFLTDNGYGIIHRIEPDMQIYFTPTLSPDSYNGIGDTFMKPRTGMWDSEKIGAGAPPLKTKYGWLFIYHGVGTWHGERGYRLGVILTALDDPTKIIYRSFNPVLEPQEDYEKNGWVDNVVFTCGAVPEYKDSNAVLDKDDEILVYYGAGDSVIAVAKAKISDLLPPDITE